MPNRLDSKPANLARVMGTVLLGFLGAGLLLQAGVKAFARQPAQAPPTVTDHLDLNQYQGRWFEVASMPMFFQRNCACDTQAHYQVLPSGQVSVVNQCWTSTGEKLQVTGRAKVVDTTTNAKLKVTFLNLFGWRYLAGGDYWVLDVDPDYTMAVVGHPNRKYGWLLARDPNVSTEQLAHFVAALRDKGYDTCRFNVTLQTNGNPNIKAPAKPVRLCDVVR
jgi:apolipoprotein D and lipocalin family protein